GGGDLVGVGGGGGLDRDLVARPEVVQAVEGVPGGDPVCGHCEVADLARQCRTWHVTGPQGQLGQARGLEEGEPPRRAEPWDADEREGLPGDQVEPGGDRPGAAVGPPFPLQLTGEGVLMLACLLRGAPQQVRKEQHHYGSSGDTALAEDTKHSPHCAITHSKEGDRGPAQVDPYRTACPGWG